MTDRPAFVSPQVVAESAAIRELLADLVRSAATDATILLVGETGTGKEVMARVVHGASARADGPFVPVNCGALPETLIESELFGHARGAFTGAGADKAGLFEEAAGGTLFLDEVGELPLPLQVRLLRALQERRIRRVGETRERPIDVRVVAATNRDLAAMMKEGQFREDLYFRLNVVSFRLPPLRERRGDIPPLVRHTLAEMNARHGRSCTLSAEALDWLCLQRWPGNVRELKNLLEQVVVLARGNRVDRAELIRRGEQDPASRRALVTAAATPTNADGSEPSRWAIGWLRFGKTGESGRAAYVRPVRELQAFDEARALLPGTTLRVGRDSEQADLALSTDEISRLHMTVDVDEQGIVVTDRGSRNGTFVDGERLEPSSPRRLESSGALRLGKEWVGVIEPVGAGGETTIERVGSWVAATWPARAIEVKAFEHLVRLDRMPLSTELSCVDGVLCLSGSSKSEATALTAAHIEQALRASQGNKREAARLLGISPQTLYTKMRAFGL